MLVWVWVTELNPAWECFSDLSWEGMWWGGHEASLQTGCWSQPSLVDSQSSQLLPPGAKRSRLLSVHTVKSFVSFNSLQDRRNDWRWRMSVYRKNIFAYISQDLPQWLSELVPIESEHIQCLESLHPPWFSSDLIVLKSWIKMDLSVFFFGNDLQKILFCQSGINVHLGWSH